MSSLDIIVAVPSGQLGSVHAMAGASRPHTGGTVHRGVNIPQQGDQAWRACPPRAALSVAW